MKRVAIVGFAESYRQAPFTDASVEIWGLNELYRYIVRWDRWFEIHDDDTLGVTKRIDPVIPNAQTSEMLRHIEWIRAQPAGKPIYMLSPSFLDGSVPAAVRYPLEDMIARFGRYFTSTPAYMIALAIAEGFQWIGIYGIDLGSAQEYRDQRPCFEYLIGMARGMGITVKIADGSALLRAGHLYGCERQLSDVGVINEALLRDRIAKLTQQRDEASVALSTLDGAVQEAQNLLKILRYRERGVVMPDSLA